jgi:hypothetical protein
LYLLTHLLAQAFLRALGRVSYKDNEILDPGADLAKAGE